MKYRLLEMLACPKCDTKLELEVTSENAGQIQSGFLHCKKNGCKYPIVNYVPRFVDQEKYTDTFSLQRLVTRKHFKDFERDKRGYKLFSPTTNFTENDVRQGVNLEAGCGYGRYLDVVDSMGGEVVGFDLSTESINLAQDFVGLRENVHLVQCDVFHPPFRKELFNRIFSIGVLHHTPNTRSAFESLVPFLRPGGDIAIWLYTPKLVANSNRWRAYVHKLPHKVLFYWCVFNELVFSWIRRLPGIGWRFNRIIPGCIKWDFTFWMRVVADLDGLSPKFAHTHTPKEVKQWFVDIGLKSVESLPRETSVRGRKLEKNQDKVS